MNSLAGLLTNPLPTFLQGPFILGLKQEDLVLHDTGSGVQGHFPTWSPLTQADLSSTWSPAHASHLLTYDDQDEEGCCHAGCHEEHDAYVVSQLLLIFHIGNKHRRDQKAKRNAELSRRQKGYRGDMEPQHCH